MKDVFVKEIGAKEKGAFFKKVALVVKSKAFIITLAVVVYTVLVAFVAIKIDRARQQELLLDGVKEQLAIVDEARKPETEQNVVAK